MPDPISKPKGFGVAALAKRVVDAYGVEEVVPLLSNRQCKELGIEEKLCEQLQYHLGGFLRLGGNTLEITSGEEGELLDAGFSSEFVEALVRLDKKPVLQKRT